MKKAQYNQNADSEQPSTDQLELVEGDYNKRGNVDENNRHSTGHSDGGLSPPEDFKFYTPKSKLRTVVKQSIIFLVVCIAFYVANVLHIKSDVSCPFGDDADRCIQEFVFPNVIRWVIQVFIAAVIFSTIIVVGLHCKISPLYSLVSIANVVYLAAYYDPVVNKHQYGQIVGLFLGVFTFIILWVVFVVKTILFCLRKRKWLTIIGLPSFILLCALVLYFSRIYDNCSNWNKGIAGGSIQEVEGTCQIVYPDVCVFEITSGWFDLSRFQTCGNYKGDPEVMATYYSGNKPIVAFPRTEKFSDTDRYGNTIQQAVLGRVQYFDSLDQKGAEDYEIFIDKTKETKPKLKIQVKRDEELAKQRKQIQSDSAAKNVIVIYIDALSRAASMRTLKKTLKWFENRAKSSSDYDVFQFFKYHSITPFTTYNLQEALFGTQPPRQNFDQKKKSFLQTYKDNGYITGYSTDFCQDSSLDLQTDDKLTLVPYDHEGISFACDPHYTDPVTPFSMFKGPFAARRRCLYGKDVADHVLDYGNQFWRAYPEEKKIMYFDFLDAHEGTGEVVKYLDVKLEKFLKNLDKDGMLKDTTVLMYSDHGLHMHGLFWFLKYEEVGIEVSLPLLYLSTPKEVSQEYKDNIKANEQKLVSAHDIYYTLLSFADKQNTENLNNSLLGNLPNDRTCDTIGMTGQTCKCNYN